MKLLQFIALLQGILSKTIDEVEQKANELTEETVEQDESKVDISAFDFIIKIITEMKARYILFKESLPKDDTPSFNKRLSQYNLSLVEDDDEDDSDEGHGGLH